MNVGNEKGVVLVTALIILALLMVIGTSLTMTTSIEMSIARNEKVAQTAFYRAENARVIAAEAIQTASGGTTWTDGDNFQSHADIVLLDGDFFEEGFDTSNTLDTVSTSPDLQMSNLLQADVDIDKTEVGPMPGASAEFGSGYEGVGHESMIQAIYRVESIGREPSGAVAQVRLEYRLLPY